MKSHTLAICGIVYPIQSSSCYLLFPPATLYVSRVKMSVCGEKVHTITSFKASKKTNNELLEMQRSDNTNNGREEDPYYI
eukprot:scaffold4330_cov38-Attheya_sp.AAC.1